MEAPPAPGQPPSAELRRLCAQLGCVTIVAKGEVDQISNGVKGVVVGGSGSRRRAGGQGDILAGGCDLNPFAVRRVH